MGQSISLEDERGGEIENVVDTHRLLLGLLRQADLQETCCLRFVDPYGNTIFNRLQMGEFLQELEGLHDSTKHEDQRQLLSKIEEFARRCAQEPHLYIKIWGD